MHHSLTHTHTHTHTRSLFLSLCRLYMCVIERGVPSLSRCVCMRGDIEGEESCECLETPGSIVSNLSVALRPNEKDLERFEIANSQVLCS